ncbi:MAG: hypothetical protein NC177_16615 [Ruminococcus flavefaciens]|nr:hypothetical protein [Ruminococcus flavefaciens]
MSKQDDKKLYEQQENKLLAQSDAFISLLTKRGILEDHNIDDDKIRAAQKEKRKSAYHNTQMLLKHYRKMVWVFNCYPEEILQELEKPFESFDSMVDRLDLEMSIGNKRLEQRMETAAKSRLLLDRLNEALTVLRKEPNRGERLYNLIYTAYLSPEKLKLEEILYRLDISQRHYYRLREQAISILSIRLWSAPNEDVDMWLDMLTLFENLE